MKTKFNSLKRLSRRELTAICGSGLAIVGGGNGGTNNGGTNGNIVQYCLRYPCPPDEPAKPTEP